MAAPFRAAATPASFAAVEPCAGQPGGIPLALTDTAQPLPQPSPPWRQLRENAVESPTVPPYVVPSYLLHGKHMIRGN